MNSILLNNNDIPVLLIGYNRPELFKRRIAEISKMPIKHLYISIDGGPASHARQINDVIKESKSEFKKFETFNLFHHTKNLGLVKNITSSISTVLEKFKYVVVIEDDIELSNNFYTNMVLGFNVQMILNLNGIVGGYSPLNLKRYRHLPNYWRVSKYCNIWGWGCTAKLWSEYKFDLNYVDFSTTLNKSNTWKELNSWQKELWTNRFIKVQNSPFSTWDIQLQYLSFLNDFQNIYPISSFVRNEGFSDPRAAHTKEKKPRWMTSEIGDNRLINSTKLFKYSSLMSKTIDANTFAGDTKIFRWWSS